MLYCDRRQTSDHLGRHAETLESAGTYAGKHDTCSASVVTNEKDRETLNRLARGKDTQLQAKPCPLAPAAVDPQELQVT